MSALALSLAPAGWGEFASLEDALPAYGSRRDVIPHLGYTLRYSERHEQAEWVAYLLTAGRLEKDLPRKGTFRPDPKVRTGSATPGDYRRSGYDRGHLAPAADMKWSERAMSESFYMSNMSPQVPEFNRGIWNALEERGRDWARESQSLYIVTGPVLGDGLPEIGGNGVSVPRYFYKVLLDYHDPGYKAIGFIIPNTGDTDSLAAYMVTVDSVESLTGIDFFPSLPDPLEKTLERSVHPGDWGFSGPDLTAAAADSTPASPSTPDTAVVHERQSLPASVTARQIIAAAVCVILVILFLWLLVTTLGDIARRFRRKR